MRTHRNTQYSKKKKDSGAKEIHQFNHDRPDLRQPGMGVSHQPPMLLLS